MSSCDSRTSTDTDGYFKGTSLKRRTSKWEHDPQQALVLEPENRHLTIEDINDSNSKYRPSLLGHRIASHVQIEATNSFEVQLPRWRNHVDIFKDMESELGFVATLQLDQLGLKKNWQRRLGMNYKVLHVKGKKPTWN